MLNVVEVLLRRLWLLPATELLLSGGTLLKPPPTRPVMWPIRPFYEEVSLLPPRCMNLVYAKLELEDLGLVMETQQCMVLMGQWERTLPMQTMTLWEESNPPFLTATNLSVIIRLGRPSGFTGLALLFPEFPLPHVSTLDG